MAANKYGLRLNIGHDMDGNIYDWVGAVIDGMIDILGYDEDRFVMPDQYSMWECWGFTAKEFFSEYDKLLHEGLLAQPGYLLKGELDFMVVCAQRGHFNHIVTARTGGPYTNAKMADTFRWCSDQLNAAPIHSINFSYDKNCISTDVFFDDHVNNIRDLIDGDCLAPFLVDRPWNREATDLDDLRIYSPEDKLRVLLDVEATIADALGVEAHVSKSEEAEITEKAFWDRVEQERSGGQELPDYIKVDQMIDQARKTVRSPNERIRNG